MITVNGVNLCENCFTPTDSEKCPSCGFSKSEYEHDLTVLSVGSVLSDRYLIGKVIGKGGFGITYLAYDMKLECKVAVKEYYPYGLASRDSGSTQVIPTSRENKETFKSGADKFYDEARLVAKFNTHPNIVSVYDFFYGNDTVYFTMGYLEGMTLKSYLSNNGPLTAGQALYVANEVSNALIAAHSANILHRDISPDNIMICDNGTIKLLDFGAARQVLAEGSHSLSVILKQGFAPIEQYQKKGNQGPWTDIYSLGATLYYSLTLDLLDDPMSRLDNDEEYSGSNHGIDEQLWQVIRKATMLKTGERYQDIFSFRDALSQTTIAPEPIFRNIDRKQAEKYKATHFTSVMKEPSNADITMPAKEAASIGVTMPAKEAASIGVTMPAKEAAPIGMTMPAGEGLSHFSVETSDGVEAYAEKQSGKKKKTGLIIGIIAAIAVIGVGIGVVCASLSSDIGASDVTDVTDDVSDDDDTDDTEQESDEETEETEAVTEATKDDPDEPVDVSKLYLYADNNGGLILNRYYGTEPDVVIPAEINGVKVNAVGSSAFSGNNSIKFLTVPDGVTNIGMNAFRNCDNLKMVTFKGNIQSIGMFAFDDCPNLESVKFNGSVKEFGECCFSNCHSLLGFKIPDGTGVLGKNMFHNCSSLKNVTVPDSVRSIPYGVFSWCTSIEKISVAEDTIFDNNALIDASPDVVINYRGGSGNVTTAPVTEDVTSQTSPPATTTSSPTTTPPPAVTTTENKEPAEDKNNVKIGNETYRVSMTGCLNLSGKNLRDSDIKGLERMTKVSEIILSDNQITDLSVLSGLTQLEKLTFHNNKVSDLSFAKKLTNLVVIGAENNGISDISALSKCTRLEEIWLQNNNIRDLKPLSKCTKVKRISFSYNPVSDISALSDMKGLEQVFFIDCSVSDIRALRGFRNLKDVYFTNNSIKDLTPLSSSVLDNLNVTNNALNGNFDALRGVKICVLLCIDGNNYDPDRFFEFACAEMNGDEDGFEYYI